jgi:hypothetical protein
MGATRRIKTKRRTRYVLSRDKALLRSRFFALTDLGLTRLSHNRDYDQVRADIKSPKHLSQYKATKAAEDLPGLGQFYCVECAKWFEGEHNLLTHRKGKNHKRRSVSGMSNFLFIKGPDFRGSGSGFSKKRRIVNELRMKQSV